jgi:hypothetical protein
MKIWQKYLPLLLMLLLMAEPAIAQVNFSTSGGDAVSAMWAKIASLVALGIVEMACFWMAMRLIGGHIDMLSVGGTVVGIVILIKYDALGSAMASAISSISVSGGGGG